MPGSAKAVGACWICRSRGRSIADWRWPWKRRPAQRIRAQASPVIAIRKRASLPGRDDDAISQARSSWATFIGTSWCRCVDHAVGISQSVRADAGVSGRTLMDMLGDSYSKVLWMARLLHPSLLRPLMQQHAVGKHDHSIQDQPDPAMRHACWHRRDLPLLRMHLPNRTRAVLPERQSMAGPCHAP